MVSFAASALSVMNESSSLTEHPFRYYSFWSINGELDLAKLCRQMDAFQQAGLDGVVFHPRFYPGIPAYLSADYLGIVNETILYAKSIGLRFWLYDENGWPSGTADGRLLESYPDEACVRLDLEPGIIPGAVTTFHRDKEGRVAATGEPWSLVPRRITGIDCLNPQASRHFLELIHEKYRLGLSAEAFDYVEAFFTDEPESGASWEPLPTHAGVPWTRGMEDYLAKIWGEDFRNQLPLLFCAAPGAAEARTSYWELIADLFGKGFLEPYRLWCERYGKLLVGHVKGEEHPLFQIPMVGSCQQIYRQFGLPGIDALERFPSNNFFPRQAASVAAQFGNGRCVVEGFGGSGWGASPEDLERYLLWLGRNGITDCVLHLSQYDLNSRAIRDWPPSQPLHLSWTEVYPEVLAKVRQELTAHPTRIADTLVIAPYRGIMADYEPRELLETNIHNAAIVPDTPASRTNAAFLALIEDLSAQGISYHVTDERSFEEEASADGDQVRLGQCLYRNVIAAEGCRLSPAASSLLAKSSEAEKGASIPSRKLEQIKVISEQDLQWQTSPPSANALFLEPREVATGHYQVTIPSSAVLPHVILRFADSVDSVHWNESPLTLSRSAWGWEATVSVRSGANELSFHSTLTGHPFAWLLGTFSVGSLAPWEDINGHRVTSGPFRLEAPSLPDAADAIGSGLPFSIAPVQAMVAVEIPAGTTSLRFIDPQADALRVRLGNAETLWTWGPDWQVDVPPHLVRRKISVTVDFYPSTFNHFGPHHYFRGDAHIISPDQFIGVRNFADPPAAPSMTLTREWRFRPLSFPRQIAFISWMK